jgi:NADH-quinone oxidoreductase subunit M
MLAGVLLKMGAYGLIRICLTATPEAFVIYAPALALLALVGIVYGAAMALGQSDLKRLVAYSSVAHMGFVLLGLATGSEIGLAGAMLGMVSHGIVSALLFFLVGGLYERAHTREMSAFGGLGQQLPKWATVFVVASMASLGLPGLSGFPGEFAAVIAGFSRWGWWLAVVGLGIVLAAAYSLRAVRVVVQGESRSAGPLGDLRVHEIAAVAPLVILTVLLGVRPSIITDVSAATLEALSFLLGPVK